MLAQRIVTAVAMLALFLAALFFLPVSGWSVLILILVMQGVLEWARLCKFSGRAVYAYWCLTLVLILAIAWFDAYYSHQAWLVHFCIYALSAVLWLIVAPIWLIAGWQVRQPLLLAMTGWVLLIPTGLAMLDLRALSPWWLLGVMGLVWMADIAAYFTGRAFGKTRLAPNISPSKTWEGVMGALLGATGYVLLVTFMSNASVLRNMLPVLILISWWWVGLAVIGDLFESAMKRQAGVKDSGTLLPGHGGMLDRIDALTSTLPLAAMLLLSMRLA